MKKIFLILLAALISSSALAAEIAKPSIKIGELFCYTGCADLAPSWQNGWQMALDEINKSGGVFGKTLEVISRDDKGNPSETIKSMEELKSRENIKIFFGTLFSHTSLAASSFAKQNQLLMLKGFDASGNLTGKNGHDLYFQVGPTVEVSAAILAEKAAGSGKKRWAFIAPDYEMGRNYVEYFQRHLKRLNPDVEFVETQWFPYGKMDAGSVAQVIAHANPDGIFIFVMSTDYAKIVREGNKRKLFDNRMIISPVAGSPQYIEPLGNEAPIGWLSGQGYPAEQIDIIEHKVFVEKYKKTFGKLPDTSSFYGYTTLKILADAINAARTDEPKKVAEVMRSKEFSSPYGLVSFRQDGLSTIGTQVGMTGFINGKPTMINPQYIKPEKYMPSVEKNLKSREKEQK